MLKRRLAGTGVYLTEIGFGSASIGNLYHAISDEVADATITAAWDAGIRYFDTAPHYGLGLSEVRLGRALRRYPRDEFIVSTKVGRRLVPRRPPADHDEDVFQVPGKLRRVWDFTPDGIRRSVDDSLERLGLDRVDVLYLHDPDLSGTEYAATEGVRALRKLREEHLVQAIGIGTNSATAVTELFAHTDIDTAMLAGRFTLLEHDTEQLLAAAGSRSIVAAAVFNSGLLASPEPDRDSSYNYGTVTADILAHATALATAARRAGSSLPAAAIAFPLRNPRVASAVLGMASPEQVQMNIRRYLAPPPEHFWSLTQRPLPSQARQD